MAFNYNYSGSKAGHTQPMADINTTPLVDVMLVLLVVFIITAPLFRQAVPIDLPRVNASKLDDQPRAVKLALDTEGKISINGQRVTLKSLGERLRTISEFDALGLEIHLRADRGTRYERVAEVMAAVQAVGITKIAFVTEGAGTEPPVQSEN
jgi:biopolymer transport protein ExbD